MDNTNNYIYAGGKFLAKGSFGCVYKPALKCKDKPTRLDGYVSKIMGKNHAEIEIEEQKEIDKIDPNYYYHLKIGESCIPDMPDTQNDNRLTECNLMGRDLDTYANSRNIDKLQEDYRIVHIEDGGMGLDGWIKNMNNVKKFKDVKFCEMMLYNFTRIIYALDEFNRHKMGHFDLKTGNIVYNDKTNRFNLIDFGFLSAYDDFTTKIKNWGIDYWVNPIERAFVPHTKRENDDIFFNPIISMARSQLTFSDFVARKSHEYNYLKDRFRRYFTGYRYTFTTIYNIDDTSDIYFNQYGLNNWNNNHEISDQMAYDYIRYTRELIKDGKNDDQIKDTIQKMIISKLNTFSMSLVMTQLLSSMISQHRKGSNPEKILINYGNTGAFNKIFMNEIETISGYLSNFYKLMLKMNVPSFSNRISTSDALEYYITEIYQPIRQKYTLPHLDFMEARMKMQRTKKPIKQITMKKKQVQSDLVINPLTGRYVNKKGQVAKTLIKRGLISASKSAEQPKKLTKKCTPPKVLNPETNRCINKSSTTYKKINITRRSKTDDKTKTKKCPPGKILNLKTNRCVNKDGSIGKKLLTTAK